MTMFYTCGESSRARSRFKTGFEVTSSHNSESLRPKWGYVTRERQQTDSGSSGHGSSGSHSRFDTYRFCVLIVNQSSV